MITGDRLEPILLVQTIHLLQDEVDITGFFVVITLAYVISLICDVKVFVLTTFIIIQINLTKGQKI